jgi:hypothetical protein
VDNVKKESRATLSVPCETTSQVRTVSFNSSGPQEKVNQPMSHNSQLKEVTSFPKKQTSVKKDSSLSKN